MDGRLPDDMNHDVTRQLNEAYALLERSADQEALIVLERVFEAASTHRALGRAWGLKSYALLHLGHLAEALDAAERALAIEPGARAHLIQRALVLSALGRHDEALSEAARAVEMAPDDVLTWTTQGRVLSNAHRYHEALAAYAQAAELDPRRVAAWRGRADALYHLGRFDEAAAAYDRAASEERGQRAGELLVDKARALYRAGRFEDALLVSQQASAQDPTLSGAREVAGAALDTLGRKEEALVAFDHVLALTPSDPQAWRNRGAALYRLDRPEEALAAFDRAVQLEPNHADTQRFRARVRARQWSRGERARAADAADDTDVLSDPNVWEEEALALFGLKDYRAALVACERALQLDPARTAALVLRAKALFALRRYPAGVAAAFRTIAVAWRQPRSHPR